MVHRPDVHFHCDVDYDPFLYMEDHNKTYGARTASRRDGELLILTFVAGFTITMYEFGATIPTLWDTTKEFIKAHPEYVAKNNAMGYMSDDGGNSYNLCHCAYACFACPNSSS